MSLSMLGLATLLILLAINWLGWVAVSSGLLGVISLVTGVLILLELGGVWSYRMPKRY